MKRALTLDDVALVPQYNDITSRTEPELSTWLTKNIRTNIPIINSPMDSVINFELAKVLGSMGGTPILHRFYKDDKDLINTLDQISGTSNCAVSVGIGEGDTKLLNKLFQKFGNTIVAINIDLAHGHSLAVIERIKFLKDVYPQVDVIAGAVCTALGFQDLVNAGADAVRVGVGPGSVCTTRLVTGFGVPQFTALKECGEIARKFKVPMICDGGIRDSRDITIALAVGASTVMLGKLLAATDESAATKTDMTAKYRGQASAEFQESYFGAVKPGTVPEGIDTWIPRTGPARTVIHNLLAGVRSGFTYGGARNIKELQRKAEFVEVTPTYMEESRPHGKA